MPQSFECPNCHAPLDYDAKRPSATIRCEYCSSTVIVPDDLREPNRRAVAGMDQAFVLAEAARLVQSGRKIEAIKQVREAFGMGLKEAKDVVDAIERHETVHLGDMSTSHVHLESVTAASPTPTANKGRGCFLGIFLLAILVFVGIGAASVLLVGREETTIEGVVSVIEESLGGTAVSIELDEIEIPPIPTVSIEIIFPTIESQVTAAPAFAEVVHEFGGEEGIGPGFFNDTRRLAVDGAGNIYTGDYSDGRIQIFDADGAFLSQMNVGEDVYMSSMTVDRDGIVYVGVQSQILRFEGATGAALDPLPYSLRVEVMTTAPDGSLIIMGHDRLLRLDAQGNVALDVADPFAEIADFAMMREDIAVDGAGNMYILGSETVYKLDANGRFVNRIGSKGDAADQFRASPLSVAVDGQGRVYVDDIFGILVFDANGRYLDTIPFVGAAFEMLVTTQNQLLVMDRNGNRVVTFDLNK